MYYKRIMIFKHAERIAVHLDEGVGRKRRRKTVLVDRQFWEDCKAKLKLECEVECIGLFCESPPCVVIRFGPDRHVVERDIDPTVFQYMADKTEEIINKGGSRD